MGKFKVGDRVRFRAGSHGYPEGAVATVVNIDSSGDPWVDGSEYGKSSSDVWFAWSLINEVDILSPSTTGNINSPAHNGGLGCSYYKITLRSVSGEVVVVECKDLIRALNLNFAEGNIFKELVRTGNARSGNGKEGNTDERAYEKMYFFASDLLNSIKTLSENTAV